MKFPLQVKHDPDAMAFPTVVDANGADVDLSLVVALVNAGESLRRGVYAEDLEESGEIAGPYETFNALRHQIEDRHAP